MPSQHSRDPYDLGDDNYGEYCGKLKDFLAEENSMPRPLRSGGDSSHVRNVGHRSESCRRRFEHNHLRALPAKLSAQAISISACFEWWNIYI